MQQPTASNGGVNLLHSGSFKAAAAGAVGGFVGFLFGELFNGGGASASALAAIFGSAIWAASIGAALGLTILAYDNWQSLRGKWNRDLLPAIPLFAALSFGGGAAGQIAYLFAQNSLTRDIGWALMGAAIGAGIGLLRRDKIQAQRGAMGGALGGFIGGFIFDALAVLISSAGDGAFSRAIGLIIMGALIALLMRVVQDALKSAWLLGITTGPYEGREYSLNTARVSVGRSELNDIALFREEAMPPQLGALVFQNDAWWWQGTPVMINGAFSPGAQLHPGDTIQLGATNFRFQTRSMKTPATGAVAPPSSVTPSFSNAPQTPMPPVTPAAMTVSDPLPPCETPSRDFAPPRDFSMLPQAAPHSATPPNVTAQNATPPIAISAHNAPSNVRHRPSAMPRERNPRP